MQIELEEAKAVRRETPQGYVTESTFPGWLSQAGLTKNRALDILRGRRKGVDYYKLLSVAKQRMRKGLEAENTNTITVPNEIFREANKQLEDIDKQAYSDIEESEKAPIERTVPKKRAKQILEEERVMTPKEIIKEAPKALVRKAKQLEKARKGKEVIKEKIAKAESKFKRYEDRKNTKDSCKALPYRH